jgi:hypothetical protein
MKKAIILGLVGLAVLIGALSGVNAYVYYDNGPYYYGYTYQYDSPDYYYTGYSPWNKVAFYPGQSYDNPTKVHSSRYGYHLDNSYDPGFSYDYYPRYGAVVRLSARGSDRYDYRDRDYVLDRQKYNFVRDTLRNYEEFRYNSYGKRTGDVYGVGSYAFEESNIKESNWRNKEVYDSGDYDRADYSKYIYGDTKIRDSINNNPNREHQRDEYYYKPRINGDGTYNWRY